MDIRAKILIGALAGIGGIVALIAVAKAIEPPAPPPEEPPPPPPPPPDERPLRVADFRLSRV